MSNLLKEEYFHFGNDNIYKELWLNIQMNEIYKNYSKPLGGLWTSKIDTYYLCDWLKYIELKDPYNFDLYVGNKNSSLIKFKEDSKFLSIENNNDFKNLKDSGFVQELEQPIILKYPYETIITELPDYEKISKFYDLMYVDYFVHDCFTQFSINTMLALNPESIEYYRSVISDYLGHKLTHISDKKYISEPSKEYFEFLEYVRGLFNEIKADNYEEFIEKLYKLKQSIIEDLEKNFDTSKLNLPEDIKHDHIIKAVANNIYKEKIMKAKKLLK